MDATPLWRAGETVVVDLSDQVVYDRESGFNVIRESGALAIDTAAYARKTSTSTGGED